MWTTGGTKMINLTGKIVPRRSLEKDVASALHDVHGGEGTSCFLCKLDARTVVAVLVAQGLAMQVTDAV